MTKKIKNWFRYHDTTDIILYGIVGLCTIGVIGLVTFGILVGCDVIQVTDGASVGFNVAEWVANPANPINNMLP